MQNKFLLISIIFLITCYDLTAQDDTDNLSKIGFTCGFAGQPTAEVNKVGLLIKNKSFSALEDLLENGNPAEKFMSVVALEHLQKENTKQIDLTILAKIENIKKSQDRIMYCAGFTDIRLRMVFELFDDNQYVLEAKQWISRQSISK